MITCQTRRMRAGVVEEGGGVDAACSRCPVLPSIPRHSDTHRRGDIRQNLAEDGEAAPQFHREKRYPWCHWRCRMHFPVRFDIVTVEGEGCLVDGREQMRHGDGERITDGGDSPRRS